MELSRARGILSDVFGYSDFRGHQECIIRHLVSGGDALVLMPTGGGKSLCYQIPALIRSGTALVISPLISLMQDQVQALNQLGIRAAALNSSLSPAESRDIKQKLSQNQLDLLYVSPERVLMEGFLEFLRHSINAPSLIAIDEAHCVSQWGHDFRPEYLRLHEIVSAFPQSPCIALTATADEPTRNDILSKIRLREPQIFVSSFDRPNLTYFAAPLTKPRDALLKFIQRDHAEDSGIVYCISRKKVESTCDFLRENGIHAVSYHAGLSMKERERNQNTFLFGERTVVVATLAFGMGINKPDVRFVAHLNLPKNIEAYYQETGRAGRDGLPANVWMTYSLGDVALLKRMIDEGESTEERKRIEHLKLRTLLGYAETTQCRRAILLRYFGEHLQQPCKKCDNCISPPEQFDGTEAAQMALSAVYRTGQRFGQGHLIDLLMGRTTAQITRWRHQELSPFGIGRSAFHDKEWASIFRQLVTQGLLDIDYQGYGGLKLTEQARGVLQGKTQVYFRKESLANLRKPSRAATKSLEKSNLNNTQESLFKELRSLRMQLAKSQGIPPYMIFPDKTLLEMATLRPTSLQDLRSVYGVGETKLERYGAAFVELLQNWSAHQGNPPIE
ncbi:MAG: DNA helicase RecQ [Bdellovibrionales bacterium]|nr:DNA helicase RecQ [Bdellovibrionales bacterium]